MVKGLFAIGLTSALAFSGCSGERAINSGTPKAALTVHVIADHDVQLYEDAFVQGDSLSAKSGIIKAGSVVTAICFQGTKNSDYSSIRVRSGGTDGYAAVNSFEGSKDETPTPVFDLSPQELQAQLPPC